MIGAHLKLAWRTVKSTKLRSLFTMTGIIIGIVSVVTTVSLGEGVKHEVRSQIKEFGSDLLIVRPGQSVKRKNNGITNINLFSAFGNNATLSDNDVEAVNNTSGVDAVAPLSIINGVVSYNNEQYEGGNVVATTNSFITLLQHKIDFGEFLSETDEGKNFAVVGQGVAEKLFKENVPIGKSFKFRGKNFYIKGVLGKFEESPFTPGADFNNAIFIPYITGLTLNNGSTQVFQIIAKPSDPGLVNETQRNITESLLKTHGGQADFTVLKQEEALAVTDSLLQLVTTLVGAIAAISLFVGGIGVMNIMIVSVTERTHEIGIRKAVGATNKQILAQFLSEAIVISAVGGVIGVLLSFVTSFVLRVTTDLRPVITYPVIVLALAVSLIVGVVFGVAPAMKAARKDPIQALRQE